MQIILYKQIHIFKIKTETFKSHIRTKSIKNIVFFLTKKET